MPSDKITTKNLSYDKDAGLPPFLARLRGQQAGHGGGPDPFLAAQRRPTGRVRTASEEAEDAPVVVDEEGNVVRLPAHELGDVDDREDDGGERGAEAPSREDSSREDKARDEVRESEKVAAIGAAKKRKIGRVVGGAEDDEGKSGVDAAVAKASQVIRNMTNDGNQGDKSTIKDKEKAVKKKKAKKVKLSFGDDEG